jgi:hypothetical protein
MSVPNQLMHDILLAQNDAAKRNMGTSSALVDIVYDICARDVELRALIVWQYYLTRERFPQQLWRTN